MEENRIPKRVLYMNLETMRLIGRPRNKWQDEVREGGSGFGGLKVACWPLVPKFAGSNPAEAVRFLIKIFSKPSFRGEVKP